MKKKIIIITIINFIIIYIITASIFNINYLLSTHKKHIFEINFNYIYLFQVIPKAYNNFFIYIILSLTLFLTLLSCYKKIIKSFSLFKSKNTEHGTSRWMKNKEVKKAFQKFYRKKEMGKKPTNLLNLSIIINKVIDNKFMFKIIRGKIHQKQKVGFVFGWKGSRALIDVEQTMTNVIGCPGCGKTQSFIFPTIDILSRGFEDFYIFSKIYIVLLLPILYYILTNNIIYSLFFELIALMIIAFNILYKIILINKDKESMIITDVKGELSSKMKEILSNRGYNNYFFNLFETSNGIHYNPLQLVFDTLKKEDISQSTALINSLSFSIYNNPNSKDTFWDNVSIALSNAMFFSQVVDSVKNNDNNFTIPKAIEKFNTLSSLIINPKTKKTALDSYFDERKEYDNYSYSQYAIVRQAGANTAGNIAVSFLSKLSIFNDVGIAEMTSSNDIDISNLHNELFAIFMILPEDDISRHFLATIFLDQTHAAFSKASKNEVDNKLKRRINYLIDEFGNISAIPKMDNLINVDRGKNIRWALIVQGLEQYENVYGKVKGEVIQMGCSKTLYLLTNNESTAKWVESKLGKETIITSSQSNGEKGNISTTHSKMGRSLMDHNELQNNMNPEVGIVLTLRNYPLKTKLKMAYKYLY